jgi:hypothetical protein
VTEASAFGWHIYPPLDFALRWTGSETEWSVLEDNEPTRWRSLAGGFDDKLPFAADAVANLPESRRTDLDVFDRYGGTPPFIDADPRGPERIEFVTGILIRTRPGWVAYIRSAVNWPAIDGLQIYDGVLETEWFRSFVPTIARLTTQGKIVRLYKRIPLLSVSVIPKEVLDDNRGAMPAFSGIADLPDDIWDEFVRHRRERQNPETRATYLTIQRERARRAGARADASS